MKLGESPRHTYLAFPFTIVISHKSDDVNSYVDQDVLLLIKARQKRRTKNKRKRKKTQHEMGRLFTH